MCGIFAIKNSSVRGQNLRSLIIRQTSKLRHRGPDWSGYYVHDETGTGLGHERLAIIDPFKGDQPLIHERSDGSKVIAVVNGEIYNHLDIRATHHTYDFKTHSDSEVVLPLYIEHGLDFPKYLEGMFAVAIYDESNDDLVLARDHVGIIPLYYGLTTDGATIAASELKSLLDIAHSLTLFPPGHVHSLKSETLRQWDTPSWYPRSLCTPASDEVIAGIKHRLEHAVVRQTLSDVPWGVLLSGGLDSSLVSAITARYFKRRFGDRKIKTFCVGFEDSEDIVHAAQVAKLIGSEHYTMRFTMQNAIDAIPDAIYHMESYIKSTVRSAVPQYLMVGLQERDCDGFNNTSQAARRVRAMGIKMVLTGEGADELFGGYEKTEGMTDAEEFYRFLVGSLQVMHLSGIQRNNKIPMAHGLETRVPFLDKEFIDYVMNIDPGMKMPLADRPEKYILRKAFDTPTDPYLPDSVLWRKKERFSRGVGKSWTTELQKFVEQAVSDDDFAKAKDRFAINTPRDKEEYYYRVCFEEKFPGDFAAKTVPKSWFEEIQDIKDKLATL